MTGSVIAPAIAAAVGILGGGYLVYDGNQTGTAIIAMGAIFLILAARNYGAWKKDQDNA